MAATSSEARVADGSLASVSSPKQLCHVAEGVWKRTTPAHVQACYATAADTISNGTVSTANETDGCIPLHYAVALGAPVSTVQALCQVDPNAPFVQNKLGMTALHYACCNGFLKIPILLSCAPCTANIADDRGRLPMHCLVMKKGPLDMVKLLNEKSRREAVTAGVMGGKTILHYAAYNNPECIPYLVQMYPELVHVRDSLGQLPLHVALMCDCSLVAIKVLHHAAKETAVAKDDHWENTPLHYAVYQDNVDALEYFATVCPGSLQVKNSLGMRAVDVAKHYQKRRVIKAIFALERAAKALPETRVTKKRRLVP